MAFIYFKVLKVSREQIAMNDFIYKMFDVLVLVEML